MAELATFDEGLGDAVSRARRLVGDTRLFQRGADTVALVNDATYRYWLDEREYSEEETAIEVARDLLARYIHEPTSATLPDGTSANFSARLAAWQAFIDEMAGNAGPAIRLRRFRRSSTTEYTRS